MTKLQGKRALVTGGSRGIGAAIARRLGAEGADVAITYHSQPMLRTGWLKRSVRRDGGRWHSPLTAPMTARSTA
jgi:NAD(P)-dependent dehydrogenase (short-subunit alcohol dehydrogenase family)